MADLNLICYSSDGLGSEKQYPVKNGLPIERVFNHIPVNKMLFGNLVKSKLEKRQEKRDKLFTKIEPLNDGEWFCYLVDGEKWYYKVAQDIDVLKMHHQVDFLGIGNPVSFKSIPAPKKQKTFTKYIKDFKENICCYCEIILDDKDFYAPNGMTKDHIVPRSRGGSNASHNIRKCCYTCNQEKGNLMLHSYIQMLNMQILDYKGELLIKLQTKIKNANRIAKEIKSHE